MIVDVTTSDVAIAINLQHDERLGNFSVARVSISPN